MSRKKILLSLFVIALAFPFSANAEICKHDTGVKDRYLPVDLFTGTKWNGEETITYPKVDRKYPWTWSYREDEKNILFTAFTSLKGPVEWTSEKSGIKYQVYERVVKNSRREVFERMTVIKEGTALGRVTDERLAAKGGEFQDEGKYPVGKWKQGEKREFNRVVLIRGRESQSPTSIEIEKLSCVFDGIENSLQIRWVDSRSDFSYVFAPGRGMAHVMGTRK